MNIALIYFSGTGNTEMIADLYKTELIRGGHEVRTISLPTDIDIAETVTNADMLGIGYPVHGFNAPKIILKLCKSLPKLEKNQTKKAFIFKTSGEPVRMNDASSLKTRKLLRRSGYETNNEYGYCMPYNIIFRHSDAAAYKMWQTARNLVPRDVCDLLNGKSKLPKKPLMGGSVAFVLRAEHWGAHIIGKTFKANGKKCIKCGLCKKTCPAKNITITKKGTVRFGWHCMLCMRCAFNCPKDAIGLGLLNGWKVNGKYSFAPPDAQAIPTKHDNYCKKAYDRYYAYAQTRIDEYNSK